MTPDLRVYLVTGPVGPGRSLTEVVQQAVAGGVTCVQLRDKTADRTGLVERARGLLDVLAPHGVPLLIDDDPWAARDAGANGVHVGPHDVSPSTAREVVGPGRLVGWSIEDVAQLDEGAELAACDYLTVSPVWSTPSKRDTAPALGLDGVRAIQARASAWLPVIGIGGIDAANAADVIDAGATGVAVISAVCSAIDPRAAAAALLAAVDGARR
ncbi:MAG: thiamine phosphate synthase [Nocardioidaceae bacterium]|nr:thiamine phosphate synthase [Nocardioidaceae bacterium]